MQAFQLTKEAIWYGDARFSPDGRWLALSGKPFTMLDTTSGKAETLPLGDFRRGFAFARSGSEIAYLPDAKLLCRYELATGRIREHHITDGHVKSVAASPDGETLYLSVSGPRYGDPHAIRVLTAKDMKRRDEFGEQADELWALRMSADGNWLGATSYQRVRAWNVGTKLPKRAAVCATPKSGARCFALSADGSRLAVASSSGLEVWDTHTGKRTFHSGKHRRTVTEVACSPTKPILATGDNAGNVFLWDHAGNVPARYEWGLGEVRSLAFAPDGLRCAAVDVAGKVVIWDVDV